MFDALLFAFVTLVIATATIALRPRRTKTDADTGEAGERLATPEDILAARAVVTGMKATGTAQGDYHEVELDVMVKRPGGGQFPAHETALIPASSLPKVVPGSIVDTYYRSGDESAVVVCVPPS